MMVLTWNISISPLSESSIVVIAAQTRCSIQPLTTLVCRITAAATKRGRFPIDHDFTTFPLAGEERAISKVGTTYPAAIYAGAVVTFVNLEQFIMFHHIAIVVQAVTGTFFRFGLCRYSFCSCCFSRRYFCISFTLLTIEFFKFCSNLTSFTQEGFVTCFDSTFATLIPSDFCSKVTNSAAKTF